jgi:hypothetical protein
VTEQNLNISVWIVGVFAKLGQGLMLNARVTTPLIVQSEFVHYTIKGKVVLVLN